MSDYKRKVKARDDVFDEIAARYVERYGAALRHEIEESSQYKSWPGGGGGVQIPEKPGGRDSGWEEISGRTGQGVNAPKPDSAARQNGGSGRAGLAVSTELNERILQSMSSARAQNRLRGAALMLALVASLAVVLYFTRLNELLVTGWNTVTGADVKAQDKKASINAGSGSTGSRGAGDRNGSTGNAGISGGSAANANGANNGGSGGGNGGGTTEAVESESGAIRGGSGSGDSGNQYAGETGAGVLRDGDSDGLIPIGFPIKPAYSVISAVQDGGRSVYFISNAMQDNIVLLLRRGTLKADETSALDLYKFGATDVFLAFRADYSIMLFESEGIIYELSCHFSLNTLIDFCGFDRQNFIRGIPYPFDSGGVVKKVSETPWIKLPLAAGTTSYPDIQRTIYGGEVPEASQVRTEEVLNYFRSEYAMPADAEAADNARAEHPFAAYYEIGPSPYDDNHSIAYVRIKASAQERAEAPPSSITFLIDASVSMYSFNKLPLIKDAILSAAETADARGGISIVTCGKTADVLLDNGQGNDIAAIKGALDNISFGGYASNDTGIGTAFSLARKNRRDGARSAVIAITDDAGECFGLGNKADLLAAINNGHVEGIDFYLVGVGASDIKGMLNYIYADSVKTAVDFFTGIETGGNNLAAENAVAQIEFNPVNIVDYKLIGYEGQAGPAELADLGAVANYGRINCGDEIVLLLELTLTDSARASTAAQTGTTSETPAGATSETQSGTTSGTPAGTTSETPAGSTSETQSGAATGNPPGTSSGASSGATSETPAGSTSETPAGATSETPSGALDDDNKYADELFEIRIWYTEPGMQGDKTFAKAAVLSDMPVQNGVDFNFACSNAVFASVLSGERDGRLALELAESLAVAGTGSDRSGTRAAYIELIRRYADIP